MLTNYIITTENRGLKKDLQKANTNYLRNTSQLPKCNRCYTCFIFVKNYQKRGQDDILGMDGKLLATKYQILWQLRQLPFSAFDIYCLDRLRIRIYLLVLPDVTKVSEITN